MNFFKWLFFLGMLGWGYHWWQGQKHPAAAEVAESSHLSESGFVSAAMPNGARRNIVLILAPLNCPSEAAQRADALARRLSAMGIPSARLDHYSAGITDPSSEQQAGLNRALGVLNGEIPAVFVNGRAKANPTADEVADEYLRTSSR